MEYVVILGRQLGSRKKWPHPLFDSALGEEVFPGRESGVSISSIAEEFVLKGGFAMASFWADVRKRNTFKVGAAYAIVAWLLAQVASVFAPALRMPEWVVSFVAFILILGFPIAVIFAWVYDLTPDGIKKTRDMPLEDSVANISGRKLDFAIIGLLAAALGYVVITSYFLDEPGAISAPVSTRAAVPAIAVLPFRNLSGDPRHDMFIAGLAEDLTTRLATWRSFPVIARNSAFDPNLPSDLREVGRILNAGYLVEGSVREVGENLRIVVQVVEATSGTHVWAEQYDRSLEDVVRMQDEITEAIVAALNPALLQAETERASYPASNNLDAWTVALRGWWHLNRDTEQDLTLARELFEQAIALDPQWDWPYASLVHVYVNELFHGYAAEPDAAVAAAIGAAEQAIALDDRDPFAHHAMGHAYALAGQDQKSLDSFAHGIELNPSDAIANFCYGSQLAYMQQIEPAIEKFQRAMSLSPRDPWMHHFRLGMAYAYFAAADYEHAADWARQSIQRQPQPDAYVLAAASASYLGQVEAAQVSLRELRRLQPGIRLADIEQGFEAIGATPELIARLSTGLRSAGMDAEAPGSSQD